MTNLHIIFCCSKFKAQWLCPTTLIRSYLLPKSYIKGEVLKMLPHTRPVTHSKKEKKKKKFSVTRPRKCYHIQDRRIPKKYFKIKIQKKINQYIYMTKLKFNTLVAVIYIYIYIYMLLHSPAQPLLSLDQPHNQTQ